MLKFLPFAGRTNRSEWSKTVLNTAIVENMGHLFLVVPLSMHFFLIIEKGYDTSSLFTALHFLHFCEAATYMSSIFNLESSGCRYINFSHFS